jgi:hypothetical protein
VAGRDLVELVEDRLLDLHALGHGLDDEVDVAEALVRRGAGDPAEDGLHLLAALLLGDLLLLDQARDLRLGDLAGLGQADVDELLLDVLQNDGDLSGGDDLGDLSAHGACADDGSLEHEHGART